MPPSPLLVTGLLVTRGRPEMAAQAVKCFKAQTYPSKELVVVDDIDDPSFPAIAKQAKGHLGNWYAAHYWDRNVIVFVLKDRYSVGEKRNIGVMKATGEVIMHFDSDDWSAPTRMEDQVERLRSSTKRVTGYYEMLFHEPATGKWRKYPEYPNPDWALGTSLCYTREWAIAHPFDEVNVGEDNAAVTAARNGRDLYSVSGLGMMVARIHADNTNKDMCWLGTCLPVADAMIPVGFLD